MNLRDRNIWHILVVSYQKTKINPIWWWVGVCEKNPPVIHILVVSPNKLMGKVANVFAFLLCMDPDYFLGSDNIYRCGREGAKVVLYYEGYKVWSRTTRRAKLLKIACCTWQAGNHFWDKGLHCFTPRKSPDQSPHQKGLRVKLGVFFDTHPLGPTRDRNIWHIFDKFKR